MFPFSEDATSILIKVLTQGARRKTLNEGQKQISLGHMNDAGDLKMNFLFERICHINLQTSIIMCIPTAPSSHVYPVLHAG